MSGDEITSRQRAAIAMDAIGTYARFEHPMEVRFFFSAARSRAACRTAGASRARPEGQVMTAPRHRLTHNRNKKGS